MNVTDSQNDPSTPEPEISHTGLLAWFASSHVAANLLMVIILVAGALTLWHIKIEVFQEFNPGLIRISVPYPGASPDDVEEGICLRVEEALRGIEGIKQVTSIAAESGGQIVVELKDYADDMDVLNDVKQAIDRIEDFPPEDAEEPDIIDVDARVQVISVAVYGDVPLKSLKEQAERIRDGLTSSNKDLSRDARISLVEVAGARRYEISIEVSEYQLRRFGVSLGQVADVVRQSTLDLPGGTVKTEGGTILLRTKGQRYHGWEFEDIVVHRGPDGTEVLLRDVATIVDGFEDSDVFTYFNGKPAVMVKVFRVGEQGALEVERRVNEYVATHTMPEGIQIVTWFNRASYLRGRLDLLIRNATIGLILVFCVLVFFLDLRLAFWTTLGIPISFMGGIVCMSLFGVSVNMLSLFALLIVLGIVVDDAIVVGENVFSYRQQGINPLDAAIRGVREMAMPVFLAIATTIAAFMPLVFTKGELGKILWPIPVVVSCVLVVSLIEALLILPAHLQSVRMKQRSGPIARFQTIVRGTLQWVIDKPYNGFLHIATGWRYLTLASAITILIVMFSIVAFGHLKISIMPKIEADNIWVTLEMPQGTPVDQTTAVVKRIEAALETVRADFDEKMRASLPDRRADDVVSVVTHVSTSVGSQPFSSLAGGGPGAVATGGSGAHLAEVNVELLSTEDRSFTARQIASAWRNELGEVPGVSSLTFHMDLFSAGEAVNVQLAHEDFDELLACSEALKQELARFAGVTDIRDSFKPGKRELKLSLKPSGRAAGLMLADLARQVRQGFYGEEVKRIQRGRDDIKVMVRYPAHERRSLADVGNMRIRLPEGAQVPFHTVAQVEPSRDYAEIKRVDRRRVVNVTADIDDAVANTREINAAIKGRILPMLEARFPGLRYSFEGEKKEMAASLQSTVKNMIIALLVIFALLAVQFHSYAQPLIVMSAIPFGLVGALAGHMIMGLNISLLSGFGMVALTGVVVNDSLIMIDMINRTRKQGLPMYDAIMQSGRRRFRPIMLTTLTTFCGLTPMILERSLQAQFLIPMAVSLAFGVAFATVITLVLVPCVYLILEDVRGLVSRRRKPDTAAAHPV